MKFLFSYSFCATSTTIVSGAVAERVFLDTYMVYSMIMSGLIYPIEAGWVWGGGWLQKLGYHDYSGSGAVHLLGGTVSFWGAYLAGPRLGVFGRDIKKDFAKNNKNN